MFYYLRKFGLSKGIIGFVISAYPIFAHIFGFEKSRFIPPLDNDLLILYSLLLIMVVFVSYSLRYSDFIVTKKWFTTVIAIFLIILAAISVAKYIIWHEKAIRCGEVRPANKAPIITCVIIGLERSPNAKREYLNRTDEYMLRRRGFYPEQVRWLWVPESVQKARLRVIGYYLAAPLFFLVALCMIVLRECIDDNWRTI